MANLQRCRVILTPCCPPHLAVRFTWGFRVSPHSEHIVDEIYSREGEQHGLVLEGELVLTLETEIIIVHAGDSFSFPGNILHATRTRATNPPA